MKSGSASKVVVLYWHRTDLRLHDSPALHAALALKPSVFIPVWTWDPHYVYRARVGPNRWRFLLECQNDLSKSYTKLNPKQKLWLVREAPQTVLPKLWKKWGITHLVFEKDTDPYARERDEAIVRLAEDAGVEVIVRMGRNLFDPDDLVRKNGGKPTMSMTHTEKAAEKINGGQPDRPVETPKSVPDPWEKDRMDLSDLEHEIANPTPDLNADHRGTKDKQYTQIMGPNNDFGVPTMEEIGIDPSLATTPHRGGESVALKTLADLIADEEYIGTFEKPKSSPAAFEPQSTTLLSPHLHFGSLSIRKYWWDVDDVMTKRRKAKKPNASVPVNLPGQLLFRDMYFAAQAAIGAPFARIHGNKVARFIDWHLQSKPLQTAEKDEDAMEEDGALPARDYEIDSPEAEEWFQRWKAGRTGFPWIDALMRQLRSEGWIHHLGRHSVACFLTRGGCYVSWERGAEVFEELLIDHEAASNAGNWMWLSCTAFFAQFYRCYSPIAFGKKWDPNGDFVRRYVPELAKFDKKFIYEPWKAPIADQKKWGCRVTNDDSAAGGQSYPKPMFDFDKRRQICLDNMKHAYDVGLHGNDEKVLDGSWSKLFGENGGGEEPKKKKQKTEPEDEE
ncbi:putative DNA photolyase [Penicillium brasilianum]|uniref:Putative DNA photolyase n=1 Tax=Penicillium brasilianum TaxID=104259 RepID=A0A1S9RMA4_PENBI|nr:putative DNA photolyase [Penicillium brasilianum]